MTRLLLHFFLAGSLLCLFSACDSNGETGEVDLPRNLENLSEGRFSMSVEGTSDVEGELEGAAYHGTRETAGETTHHVLLVENSSSEPRVVDFVSEHHGGATGTYRIASTTGVDEAYFARFKSADTETLRSQSGSLDLYEDENGGIAGQFHFAARTRGGSSNAALLGGFRAEQTDDIDALIGRYFPEGAGNNASAP